MVSKSLSEALEITMRTDPGRVRGHNEDAVFANPELGLAILADGMGGYNAGEVASGMATTLLAAELETAFRTQAPHAQAPDGRLMAGQVIAAQVSSANAAIFNAAASQPQYAGMGTTLVLAQFCDNRIVVGHIGDSRLYRFRAGALEQLTRDHSLLQEQIDSGMITPEEARHSQNKNLVTRAVGVDAVVETEINEYPVLVGDIYLLCSDGLNDMLDDDEIALTLETLGVNLELAASQLIEAANDNGGRDNVSVILIKIRQEFPAARGRWGGFFNWLK